MQMIEKDYDMILEIFKKYSLSYNELLHEFENAETESLFWSSSSLELYPYQYEIDQLQKPKIYKNEPKSKDRIITNRLDQKGQCFSYYEEYKELGGSFTINNEHQKIHLKFNNLSLNHVYCVTYQESRVESVSFYTNNDGIHGEKFIVDKYLYNGENIICSIIRNGYFEKRGNSLSERTFRFDYIGEDILIYSKQLNKNKEEFEVLLNTIRNKKSKIR